MKNGFLLNTPLSEKLYLAVKELPVIDYHNHLSISDIASDKPFENITKVWISPDPYKHRAMRILGIPERLITGDGTDKEKFAAWYSCLPRLIGNALYDWSVMEMREILGIDLEPFCEPWDKLWELINEKLASLSPSVLLEKFKVEYCAPCASVTDDISIYTGLAGFAPSLRGDDIYSPTNAFAEKLSSVANISADSLDGYISACEKRISDFAAVGCKFADHALDDGFDYVYDDGKNHYRFRDLINEGSLSSEDRKALSSYILKSLASLYRKNGIAMQLHIGAKRDTSTRMREAFGPTGGYAGIGHPVYVKALTAFLDDADMNGGLPKTVLFTLNPADNAVMAILSGSYSSDGKEALVSQGPAWWWCDHYQGIYEMLDKFSSFSVLSTFIGMTTDSRSLFSFIRHDYFRRIVARWLSDKASAGLITDNFDLLADVAKRICYTNVKSFIL